MRDDLARDPSLAQANDPAVDALAITPVHHAVAGERVDALRLLLAHVSAPLVNGARALRDAAVCVNVAMVQMLLEQGADASSVGADRWVLDPELAPLLARAGASVDRSGAWIGLACTSNQGRKDDRECLTCDEQAHCAPVEWVEQEVWHAPIVVHIGGAAHASSPTMGQGGCLAMEDACVLGGDAVIRTYPMRLRLGSLPTPVLVRLLPHAKRRQRQLVRESQVATA